MAIQLKGRSYSGHAAVADPLLLDRGPKSPPSRKQVEKTVRAKLRQSQDLARQALGHDYSGLTFHPRAQAAAHSNPVPMPAKHTIGYQPERITRAPLRRITYDRGSITRTLGEGLGTVTLEGTPRPKIKSPFMVQAERQAIVETNKASGKVRSNGVRIPGVPSWRQEVAGWSSDYRIERGEPCLFDDCGRIPKTRDERRSPW